MHGAWIGALHLGEMSTVLLSKSAGCMRAIIVMNGQFSPNCIGVDLTLEPILEEQCEAQDPPMALMYVVPNE